MAAPILATKLFKPALRAKSVLRHDLIKRLNDGITSGSKLTLISAPAGFGKTTLICEWLSEINHPSAWVSLDEGDNDLTRFLVYLVTALQTIHKNIGDGVLSAIQPPQAVDLIPLLTILLNDISSSPGSFILVLDDYQVIENPQVDKAVSFLVDNSPPQLHLVITTREDPRLPIAKLRSKGQLSEFRAVDLRFTSKEASEFVNQVMNLDLRSDDVNALLARTEGWIAGLQLAAISLQGSGDVSSFIKTFTGNHLFVLDYLLEEVLHQQSESIQKFLISTSILNRLCGSLCDVLLDSPPAAGQETLEYLDHANLFMVPLDNQRHWYRYHHLFRDILRQRLSQALSPAEIASYHLRASRWFEENGEPDEAFQHALSAGDSARAAGIAEAAWKSMEENFQTAAWLGWVKKLPDDEVRSRPILCAHIALAYMDSGKPEASENYLQAAERCLTGLTNERIIADKDQAMTLPAMIALTRAYNAQAQGDLANTVKYSELALQLIPADDLFRRAQAVITLEMNHWARGDLEAARAALIDWMDFVRKAGNFVFMVASAFGLADILMVLGRLNEAMVIEQEAIDLAEEYGEETKRITAHHHLGLAMLFHEMGNGSSSDEQMAIAGKLGDFTTLVDWPYRWKISQAKLMESRGEFESSLVLLEEASRVYVKTPIPDTRPIEALKARVYLKQGKLAKAMDWVRTRGLSVEDETSYLSEFEYLTLARVRLAEYQNGQENPTLQREINLLERLLKAAEAQKRIGSVIEILVTQVLTHEVSGNHAKASMSLEHALILAEPQGYIRVFTDEGHTMKALLEEVARNREHPKSEYAKKILAFFEQGSGVDKTPQKSVNAKKGHSLDLIEPLSGRELEVLKMLRSELSGPEIANKLIISANTLRTHTKNIYNKLGVNSRRAAVQRAIELDLF